MRSYARCLSELRIEPGSPDGRSVGAAVLALAEAPELPMPGDTSGPLPPRQAALVEEIEGRRLLSAYAHRAPGRRRLWVWYRVRGGSNLVDVVAVTNVPPP